MAHKPKITPKKVAAYRAAAAASGHNADNYGHKNPVDSADSGHKDTKSGHKQPAVPMTDRHAEAEARRLWGELFGAAWHHAYSKASDADYCRVGLGVGDVRDLWKPFGRGRDWESAFLDAKRRGYC